jgi:hypothetical protein
MELGPEKTRPPRRGYEKTTAVDPVDGKLTEVYISHRRMEAVAKRGMGAAKDLAFSEREVLTRPTAVFRGIREEGERDWLCYVDTPKHSYTREGQTRPPRRGRVFLVFVNQDGVAYHRRWEECDPDDPKLPLNHDSRFSERIL